ncbi:hypothetical protein C4564_06320 [Candidatus Microgenomates bacterium]|nr:MAG: hypothetical protein C4564_06320 [Candidatus Microgenomates bacterium]
MTPEIDIIPSILTDSADRVYKYLFQAEGVASRVHIDIIDGVFADNKTIDPTVLQEADTRIMLDFHLMVNEPVKWVEKCVRSGAERIIGQVEMMMDQYEFVSRVQEAGVYPGLAIDVDTPVEAVERKLLGDLDVVLVMSVPAGFGGQKFHTAALDKIKKLSQLRKNGKEFIIADDGGVTVDTLSRLPGSGVNEVVIGTRIFEGDLAKNIHAYEKSVK